MGGVHYTPLANQIKANQNNGNVTLNLGGCQQSSSNETTNQIIGGLFDIAGLTLTAAFAAKANGSQQTQSTQQQAEQSPIEKAQGQIDILKSTLEAKKDLFNSLEGEISDLTKLTDTNYIKSLETAKNEALKAIQDKNGKQTELATKILNVNTAVETTTRDYNTALKNLTSANNTKNGLEENINTLMENIINNPTSSETDKKTAEKQIEKWNTEITNLQIDQKQTASDEAKTKMEIAIQEKNKLKEQEKENYTKMEIALKTYEEANAKHTEAQTALDTNKTLLENKVKAKATVGAEIKELEESISDLEGQLTLMKAKGNELSKKYDEADAKDGNWFTRLFSKTKRKNYKETKQILNDASKLGMSRANLEDRQDANIDAKTDAFCKTNKLTGKAQKVVKECYKDNPNITNEQINAKLKTKGKQIMDSIPLNTDTTARKTQQKTALIKAGFSNALAEEYLK